MKQVSWITFSIAIFSFDKLAFKRMICFHSNNWFVLLHYKLFFAFAFTNCCKKIKNVIFFSKPNSIFHKMTDDRYYAHSTFVEQKKIFLTFYWKSLLLVSSDKNVRRQLCRLFSIKSQDYFFIFSCRLSCWLRLSICVCVFSNFPSVCPFLFLGFFLFIWF